MPRVVKGEREVQVVVEVGRWDRGRSQYSREQLTKVTSCRIAAMMKTGETEASVLCEIDTYPEAHSQSQWPDAVALCLIQGTKALHKYAYMLT